MARFFLDLVLATFMLWIHLMDIIPAFQITGATGGVDLATGQRPFRQEIDTFAASGAAYELFILALRQLQSTNQSNPLSYFQIAGIHGVPEIPWDGVGGNGTWPGFCIHAAVAFPTWHRPYMALYEQVLWNNAQVIARTYPTSVRDQYISAARTMRIPYWDWAANPYLPNAVSQPSVDINTPEGQATVGNPLYTYTFLDTPENEGIPPTSAPVWNLTQTVRYWNATLQQSNQTAANATLIAQGPTISSLTYQLLTSVTDYSTFSCTATPGNSIENMHNNIHSCVGGQLGHMTYVEVSAFDPIFFLHHANVDRLFAMWQALSPESYIVPTVNTHGSYYEPAGVFVESGASNLAPFHSDNGTTMFTSEDVRGTVRFGYTYPELVDWNVSTAELVSNVRTAINLLYNPSVSSSNYSRTAAGRPLARAVNSSQAFYHISFHDAKKLGFNNLDMQWNIDIRVQCFAFDGPFTIDFFMGEPERDPALRATAPNLIGSHSQLVTSNISQMFPDGAPQGLVQGYVSLSHTLAAGLNRGVIRDLSPQYVVPLLSKQLQWNARSADGHDIDVNDLEGLSIIVSSRTVQPAASRSEFPKYGQLRYWPRITVDKPGGKREFDL